MTVAFGCCSTTAWPHGWGELGPWLSRADDGARAVGAAGWKDYGLGMDEQTERLSALLREAVAKRDVTLLRQGVELGRSLGLPVATLLSALIPWPTGVARLWLAQGGQLNPATTHRLQADLAIRALPLVSEDLQSLHPALVPGLRRLSAVPPDTPIGPISLVLAQQLQETELQSPERVLVYGVRNALKRGAEAQGMMLVGLQWLMSKAAEDPEVEVAWLKRRLVDALLEGL